MIRTTNIPVQEAEAGWERFHQVGREKVLATMQDHPNQSPEIGEESHVELSWMNAMTAMNDSSTPRSVPQGQTPALHELAGPWEQLELARQEIKALREQRLDLKRTIKELTLRTMTDELTGLRNRRRFREDLESAWTYAIRHSLLLSVVMIDLDDLTAYNDAFGRAAGDQALRNLADYLVSNVRVYDVVGRLTGGQFGLLLPSTDRTDARRIAERMRKGTEDMSWPLRPMTASFGVATLESSAVPSLVFVEQSLQALLYAKEHGKNRVTHFVDLPK